MIMPSFGDASILRLTELNANIAPFAISTTMIYSPFCLVVGVTDGDTLKARCGNPGQYEQIKVRLAEIDAPEKRQPFGDRSKQSLSALCFGVRAEIRSQTKDRYGRVVARVVCTGKDANAEQVRTGMAWVYDRYVTDRSLYRLQDDALRSRVGLWSNSKPLPPWEWRRIKKGPPKSVGRI